MQDTTPKSVPVAILLNLIVPGAGYMYIGRVFLGIFTFFAMGTILLLSLATVVLAVPVWFFCQLIMILDMLLLNRARNKKNLKLFKKCPRCAEMVMKEANICKHCQHEFVDSQKL